MEKKEYQNEDITVHWFPKLCSKSAKCTDLLPGVFNGERRPWIDVNQADAQSIMNTIDKCPSGALKYSLPQDSPLKGPMMRGAETKKHGHLHYEKDNPPTVKLRVVKNGPLISTGTVAVYDAQGKLIKEGVRLAFCRCGLTKNQPFCDGSHSKKNWKDDN